MFEGESFDDWLVRVENYFDAPPNIELFMEWIGEILPAVGGETLVDWAARVVRYLQSHPDFLVQVGRELDMGMLGHWRTVSTPKSVVGTDWSTYSTSSS